MKAGNNIVKVIFFLLCLLYGVIYAGYTLIINILHSSYSVVSIPAIIVPFVFLLLFQWVLWKSTEIEKRGKVKKIVTIVTILGSVPPVLCAVNLGINEYKSNFTNEKWLNNHNERVYIVDDLLGEYELMDKTRNEVISLLGAPTETSYFQDKDNIVYYLGNERGFISIDSELLVIWFNESDRVDKYEIQRH